MESGFDPRLSQAIRENNIPRIEEVVAERPELIDSNGVLGGGGWQHFAAREGRLEALQRLFELGFSVNFRDGREGFFPVFSAVNGGHADVVAYLISLCQPLEVTPSVCNPLLGAISGGRSAECVRLLLDAGIDAGHRYSGGPRGEMTATAFALMHGLPGVADMIAEHLANGGAGKKEEILSEAYRILKKQPTLRPTRILPSEEDLEADEND